MNLTKALLLLLGGTLLAIAIGIAVFYKPAHGQDASVHTLCNPDTVRQFTDNDLRNMDLEGRKRAYEKDLPSALQAPSVKVVVVFCNNPDDIVVVRKFDEEKKPPVLLSAVIYVPLQEIQRHRAE